jgi:hypothetical protein
VAPLDEEAALLAGSLLAADAAVAVAADSADAAGALASLVACDAARLSVL